MSEPRWLKLVSMAGLGVSLTLLVVGGQRQYEVDPSPEAVRAAETPSPPPWSLPTFAPQADVPPPPAPEPVQPKTVFLSDLGLLENTTFTGVVRHEDRLRFTYDPNQKRGKRSCPT